MASSGLRKMLYLPKLYQLLMVPVLCDVWQKGCHADDMADGKAMLAYDMLGTCWDGDRCCVT